MLGRSDEEIRSERKAIEDKLKNAGHEVIDSMIADAAPKNDYIGAWYLGKSIQLLSCADAAYFIDGWETARGCKIEHSVCLSYNIPIMSIEDLI